MKVETFVEQMRILLNELEANKQEELPIAFLKEALDEVNSDLDCLSDSVSDAESNITDARDNADSASGELDDAERSIGRAYDRAESAEDYLSEARSTIARLEERLEVLQRKLDEFVEGNEVDEGNLVDLHGNLVDGETEEEDEDPEPED